jgi:hypothetical protein
MGLLEKIEGAAMNLKTTLRVIIETFRDVHCGHWASEIFSLRLGRASLTGIFLTSLVSSHAKGLVR